MMGGILRMSSSADLEVSQLEIRSASCVTTLWRINGAD